MLEQQYREHGEGWDYFLPRLAARAYGGGVVTAAVDDDLWSAGDPTLRRCSTSCWSTARAQRPR